LSSAKKTEAGLEDRPFGGSQGGEIECRAEVLDPVTETVRREKTDEKLREKGIFCKGVTGGGEAMYNRGGKGNIKGEERAGQGGERSKLAART